MSKLLQNSRTIKDWRQMLEVHNYNKAVQSFGKAQVADLTVTEFCIASL